MNFFVPEIHKTGQYLTTGLLSIDLHWEIHIEVWSMAMLRSNAACIKIHCDP